MPVSLDQLQAADFSGLADQSLTLRSDAGAVRCVVDSVRLLAPHPLRAVPPFAVILRGPRDTRLPQGTYTLQHPVHGALELFVVPVGPVGEGMGYEILFN